VKNCTYALIPVALTLGACGGSTAGDAVPDPPSFPFMVSEQVGGTVGASYDDVEDTWTDVVINGVPVAGRFIYDPDTGTYKNSEDGNEKFIFSYRDDGNGTYSFIAADDYDGNTYTDASNFAYVYYETTLGEALPSIGSATYSGAYRAFVRDAAGTGPSPSSIGEGEMASIIAGDIELTANFSTMKVDGSIFNRYEFSESTGEEYLLGVSDVTFNLSDLALDGTYSGTTVGGNLEYLGGPPSEETITGTFGGAIGGATGEDTVGFVIINHDYANGNSFIETGGFTAGVSR
jgi:hypothetical protein